MFEPPVELDLDDRLTAAKSAVYSAEHEFGPHHEVVAETLEAYATLLRKAKYRTLEAVNAESRAYEIRKLNNPESEQLHGRNPYGSYEESTKKCLHCGEFIPRSATTCQVCHHELQNYAGFWLRFVARLVDELLLGCVCGTVGLIGFIGLCIASTTLPNDLAGILVLGYFAVTILVTIIVEWLYHALFEASSLKATPGKLILGLQVVNEQGEGLTFSRSTARHFAKILSAIMLNVGFIMAAFTEKKQALHDIMVDALVVRKQ